MEAEIEQPHPQQPAQQDQQPALRNEPEAESSNAAGVSATSANSAPPSPEQEQQQQQQEGDDTASLPSIPSDAVSEPEDEQQDAQVEEQEEQIVSPSVSSPPYWTHSHASSSSNRPQNLSSLHPTSGHSHGNGNGNGHARNISTASVESVLPPGAITLRDNELDDEDDDDEGGENGHRARRGNRSSEEEAAYGRDRNRACWARSVQVSDYVLVNGSATNLGAFVVWLIRVETLNGSRMNIRKRYSEFDGLRRRLVQTFPGFEAAVPALPPKSVLKRFHPRFLEKRRAGLQYFLNCILLNPEFSGSPVLKEFLFS